MKHKLQIRHLPTPEELAQAAAVELLGLLLRRSDATTPFGIALSGGRIAIPFYKSIVAGAKKSRTSFEEVHFFWADERCVPPTSAESNYATARETLFEPLAIPAANIHRIRAEMDGPDNSFPVDEAEAGDIGLIHGTQLGWAVSPIVSLGYILFALVCVGVAAQARSEAK